MPQSDLVNFGTDDYSKNSLSLYEYRRGLYYSNRPNADG